MTNVYNYIDSSGVITSDTSEILTQVQQEYKDAFGQNLNVSDQNTVQGILISVETLARSSVADNNCALANQFNPNLAGGIFLDALMSLTGMSRSAGAPSLVYATFSGVAGTIIPVDSQVKETTNNAIFKTTSAVTIPPSGTITNVEMVSLTNGPIPCYAGTLTQIQNGVLGWETCTNPLDATLGTLVQSDAQAKNLRRNALFAQGNSLSGAVIAALYKTAGVTSLAYRENRYASSQVIDGVQMSPSSIYVCVGGTATSLNIASALVSSKGGGCNYSNGAGIAVEQAYTDPYSGQQIPVKFDRPSIITIAISVMVSSNNLVADAQTSIRDAIIAYANGEVAGMDGFVVGGSVSPFQISAAISEQIPTVFIQKVQIAKVGLSVQGILTTGNVLISGITSTAGIYAGQQVTGNGIPSGTTVVSVIDANSINISNGATLTGTQVLTFTTSPTYQTTEIPINIWQQAYTNSANITVTVS